MKKIGFKNCMGYMKENLFASCICLYYRFNNKRQDNGKIFSQRNSIFRKIFLGAVILIVTCGTTAYAAEWKEIARDVNYVISVDVSSLTTDGNIVTVWEKWLLRAPEWQIKKKLGFVLTMFVVKKKYNLNKGIFTTLYAVTYGKNNEILDTNDSIYTDSVVPGTCGEKLFDFYKAFAVAYKAIHNK